MATDARRNFETQTTPASASTPRFDNAMLVLTGALDGLRKFRLQQSSPENRLELNPAEARVCISAFIDMLSNSAPIPGVGSTPFASRSLLTSSPFA